MEWSWVYVMKSFLSSLISIRLRVFSRVYELCSCIFLQTLGRVLTIVSKSHLIIGYVRETCNKTTVRNDEIITRIHSWYWPFSRAWKDSPKARSPMMSNVVYINQETMSTLPSAGPWTCSRSLVIRRWQYEQIIVSCSRIAESENPWPIRRLNLLCSESFATKELINWVLYGTLDRVVSLIMSLGLFGIW